MAVALKDEDQTSSALPYLPSSACVDNGGAEVMSGTSS
jgi:hypothetical protein